MVLVRPNISDRIRHPVGTRPVRLGAKEEDIGYETPSPVDLPSSNACDDDDDYDYDRWSKPHDNEYASKYVTINPPSIDDRRLGNQLFDFAAALAVADYTGRRPLLPRGWLDDTFDVPVKRVDRDLIGTTLCPCYVFDERSGLQCDVRLFNLRSISATGILLNGYFQSFKYFRRIERHLRRQLKFRGDVRAVADKFLADHRPKEWSDGTYATIGVHARRGDMLRPHLRQYGYTTATKPYFLQALRYFAERHRRVHLIVTSDDLTWIKSVFEDTDDQKVRLTFSTGNPAAVDLAILTLCDSLILSTGTFGWWAAWLSNGTTVYFKDWPQPGSRLENNFRKEDFYPSHWIAISG